MKKAATYLFIAALLSGASLTPLLAQNSNGVTISGVTSAIQKGDFTAVQNSVAKHIKELAKGQSMNELAKDAKFVQLVTIEDIIRTTGAENMSKLFAKDRKYAQFLNVFLKDTGWMQLYLRSGTVPTNTDVGLRVLGDIWAADGKSGDFRDYLPLATGIAAVWGAGCRAEGLQEAEQLKTKKNAANPVWRYNFFKKSHKENKLHSNFINLQPWEIRFVAGDTCDDISLEYTQNLINLPPGQYEDACWRADYTGTSVFGDSIQGPLFYAAWGTETGKVEQTVRHGGVCGALSHTGATAAASRGIPSYTVGQPGHCAYAYRPSRGEWHGGFGGPDGGTHNYIFPGEAPTNIRLMEAAFASDEKVEKAYASASLAKALEQAGMIDEAKKAWGAALKETPFNLFLQQDFQDFALRNDLYTPKQWQAYGVSVMKTFKGHGYGALQTLEKVKDKILEGLPTDQDKITWFVTVNEALADTPTSWKLDILPILDEQKNAINERSAAEKFMASVIDIHMNRGDGNNFGKAMEWAIQNFVHGGSDAFAKAFASAVANQSGGNSATADEEKDKKMREAYTKAIVAAENARSASAVHAIIQASKAYQTASDGPPESELNCPEGELVSDKGYLRLSTSCQWDKGFNHLNVLSKTGGQFHTDSEEKPYVIVELPSAVNLSGLLFVKSNSHEGRMKKMVVSRSVDGATWFPVMETEDMPKQWRIDIKDDVPARWIKVESIVPEGKKEYMHFSHALIFAKK